MRTHNYEVYGHIVWRRNVKKDEEEAGDEGLSDKINNLKLGEWIPCNYDYTYMCFLK